MVHLNKYDGESKKWSERWEEELERPLETAEVEGADRFEFSLALHAGGGGGGGGGARSSSLTLVVGAPGVPGSLSLSSSGHVYVFVFNTSSEISSVVLSQRQMLHASSSAGYFGFSVSVSLRTIAVGDPFNGKCDVCVLCVDLRCGLVIGQDVVWLVLVCACTNHYINCRGGVAIREDGR
jgi:hypothetical protein